MKSALVGSSDEWMIPELKLVLKLSSFLKNIGLYNEKCILPYLLLNPKPNKVFLSALWIGVPVHPNRDVQDGIVI